MDLKQYFLLYMIYSLLGWLCEVIATYDKQKGFVNRGFLIGPYCPIYGICSILMILLLNNYKDIFLLFIMSIIICSFAEYITSYLMEKLFNARWWDYSKKPLNLNGRVCLRNSLFFGIMGVILIKYINPFITNYILRLSINTTNILFYIILIIFLIDNIISFKIVFKIKQTTRFIKMDNTREITEKVKEILNKTFFGKRIVNAFPNINIVFKDIEKKIRGKK